MVEASMQIKRAALVQFPITGEKVLSSRLGKKTKIRLDLRPRTCKLLSKVAHECGGEKTPNFLKY